MHLRWGRFEQAVQAFQRSLVIDPGSVAAHISLASALESLERIPEAIAELRWVVDRRPRDFRSWTRLSTLCERQGDLDAAVEALERSVAANPYLDETRHQLVRVTALRDALTEEHP
ncbi:tetratricopeptide repeat protein [Myxococcota bacterium]|nr:tetratricopeptide repeat protein [Myxococcota bacterium]